MKFGEDDRPFLKEIYKHWRELSDMLRKLDGRAINLPEGLSEAAFCLEMDAVRVTGQIQNVQCSFDCYMPAGNRRIQVKACSVLPDLTSFGPRSVWDDLYFLDFYRHGEWDGSFDIYKIPNNTIYDHRVNRGENFMEQQAQGRRPRFSIYGSIIQENGMKPEKTGRLW